MSRLYLPYISLRRRVGTTDGVQMWSGMRYRNSLNKFSSSHREFDPLVQSWSAAGQLVVGMSDGSFAVWDSLTSQTFASQRSGRPSASSECMSIGWPGVKCALGCR